MIKNDKKWIIYESILEKINKKEELSETERKAFDIISKWYTEKKHKIIENKKK